MSDNTQPASSRRALREKRRAEMEALLASSKAEQEAREQAARGQKAPAEASENPPAAKPQPPAATAPAKSPTPAKKSAPSAKPSTGAPAKPAAPAKAKATPPAPKPETSRPTAQTPSKAKPGPAAPAAKPAQVPVSDPAEPALGERASLRRARDREALRERRRLQEEVSQLTTNVPTVEAAEDPKPLTRRQLRLQALAEQQKNDGGQSPVKKPGAAVSKPRSTAEEDAPETTVMSVEEALAARRQLAPAPPVDPNLLRDDDNEIDLEVLAHQREMAARAAIISRRAAERERIRQENVKAGKEVTSPDPFTGAMGNIREFEDKVARSGVSGPPTESVSLDFTAGTKSPAAKKKAPAANKSAAKPAGKAQGKPAPKPAGKPAPKPAVQPASKAAAKSPKASKPQVATASAVVAEDAAFDVVDLPRVDAVQAQGLQPLDAQTAGVRRANNMFLAMIAALAVGGIALVAGIIMMLSN
ncbi:hypothetical protein OK351_04090 [Glutamicibacter sp. MNS18]|uniref:hypothetical protein n=1 Tax=Glutamicibacter sp. MNS18 TaxID=2989817 RepID=UPI002235CBE9|nr:hypothetical protein [Glutamicibacter sp. MNS18]MCW4464686.1 hypothetical protein [Glutamicibacter sp. MNS18]